jgi:hypothetical protein
VSYILTHLKSKPPIFYSFAKKISFLPSKWIFSSMTLRSLCRVRILLLPSYYSTMVLCTRHLSNFQFLAMWLDNSWSWNFIPLLSAFSQPLDMFCTVHTLLPTALAVLSTALCKGTRPFFSYLQKFRTF